MLTKANLSSFTRQEITRAKIAKELHRGLGCPSYKKFLWLLKHNKIKNSKVQVDDTKRALHIFVEEVATVKGKLTQKR